MKCPDCNNEFIIQTGTQIKCTGCKILTTITSIITVQCEKCKKVFQIPIQSKSIMSVKKD